MDVFKWDGRRCGELSKLDIPAAWLHEFMSKILSEMSILVLNYLVDLGLLNT